MELRSSKFVGPVQSKQRVASGRPPCTPSSMEVMSSSALSTTTSSPGDRSHLASALTPTVTLTGIRRSKRRSLSTSLNRTHDSSLTTAVPLAENAPTAKRILRSSSARETFDKAGEGVDTEAGVRKRYRSLSPRETSFKSSAGAGTSTAARAGARKKRQLHSSSVRATSDKRATNTTTRRTSLRVLSKRQLYSGATTDRSAASSSARHCAADAVPGMSTHRILYHGGMFDVWWHRIVSNYLSVKDIIRLQRVCRDFYHFFRHEEGFRIVCKLKFKLCSNLRGSYYHHFMVISLAQWVCSVNHAWYRDLGARGITPELIEEFYAPVSIPVDYAKLDIMARLPVIIEDDEIDYQCRCYLSPFGLNDYVALEIAEKALPRLTEDIIQEKYQGPSIESPGCYRLRELRDISIAAFPSLRDYQNEQMRLFDQRYGELQALALVAARTESIVELEWRFAQHRHEHSDETPPSLVDDVNDRIEWHCACCYAFGRHSALLLWIMGKLEFDLTAYMRAWARLEKEHGHGSCILLHRTFQAVGLRMRAMRQQPASLGEEALLRLMEKELVNANDDE